MYFIDASDVRPDRDPVSTGGKTWDIMYASIVKGL
jgi:hypothetical protein